MKACALQRKFTGRRMKGMFMMKNVKKSIAGLSAMALSMSLTACGGGSEGGSSDQTSDTTATTTTAVTAEVNTATVAEDAFHGYEWATTREKIS